MQQQETVVKVLVTATLPIDDVHGRHRMEQRVPLVARVSPVWERKRNLWSVTCTRESSQNGKRVSGDWHEDCRARADGELGAREVVSLEPQHVVARRREFFCESGDARVFPAPRNVHSRRGCPTLSRLWSSLKLQTQSSVNHRHCCTCCHWD